MELLEVDLESNISKIRPLPLVILMEFTSVIVLC